ncbi:MAG: hypothetical protein R3A48_28975 [Polyangiales bacterium]
MLPNGFTASHIPTNSFAVRLAVGAGASRPSGLKVMLVACMVSAGTATAAVPVEVGDATDANEKFGARSRLAGACRAFRRIAPLARLFACPVADPGGTAATAVLTFAGPATAAGVIRMRVAGQLVREVQIPSGTTLTQAAAAVKAELDTMSELPCTGALSGSDNEVLTLTASNTGAQGNQLRVQFEITATGVTIALNAASAATRGKAYFGSGSPATAGSGTATLTSALAAIEGAQYDRVGVDVDDDTNRTAISLHATTQSGINVGKRRMIASLGLNDTPATVQADAVAINDPRIVLLCQKRPHQPGNEILGAYLATKVYGPLDGALPGEQTYRAAKANGLSLYPAVLATDEEERLASSAVNSLLADGVTVIGADGAHPGFASVVRPVTTRTRNAQGGTDLDARHLEGRRARCARRPSRGVGRRELRGQEPHPRSALDRRGTDQPLPDLAERHPRRCALDPSADGGGGPGAQRDGPGLRGHRHLRNRRRHDLRRRVDPHRCRRPPAQLRRRRAPGRLIPVSLPPNAF